MIFVLQMLTAWQMLYKLVIAQTYPPTGVAVFFFFFLITVVWIPSDDVLDSKG